MKMRTKKTKTTILILLALNPTPHLAARLRQCGYSRQALIAILTPCRRITALADQLAANPQAPVPSLVLVVTLTAVYPLSTFLHLFGRQFLLNKKWSIQELATMIMQMP